MIIHVRDGGLGISSEDMDHIFERFYRGSDSAVQRVRGTGLGLSLVHDIVTAHGGSIQVNSTPGTGSKFSVSLPSGHTSENGELS